MSALDTHPPPLTISTQPGGQAGPIGPSAASASKTPLSRKRPPKLALHTSPRKDASTCLSLPSSPVVSSQTASETRPAERSPTTLTSIPERDKFELRVALTGRPRRRPSVLFNPAQKDAVLRSGGGHQQSEVGSFRRSDAARPPEIWRDPSQDILSGKGSTLQHARSVYAEGPIEVLPGVFLGDEHNARDEKTLYRLGITTILNVAKETDLSFRNIDTISECPPSASSGRGRSSRALTMSLGHAAKHASQRRGDQYDHTMATASSNTANSPSLAGSGDETYVTPVAESATVTKPVTAPPSDSKPLLRSTSSTPNLRAEFTFSAATLHQSESEQKGEGLAIDSDVCRDSAPHSRRPDSGSTVSETESSTSTDATLSSGPGVSSETLASEDVSEAIPSNGTLEWSEDNATQEGGALYSDVELPADATRLTIPSSPASGRPYPLRYVKLPWTHDQTDLAGPNGGFAQGCAVISEALAIDHYGRRTVSEGGGDQAPQPGKVLVHCQCGVSRSATLVIAFVMQASALDYSLVADKGLAGMHACYDMVKSLSASISPNISLIFQLVEWERHLTAEAKALMDLFERQNEGLWASLGSDPAVSNMDSEPNDAVVAPCTRSRPPIRPSLRGWSTETMDEEAWREMRLEEERKEQAEEAGRRERLQLEVQRQAEERKRSQTVSAGSDGRCVTSAPWSTAMSKSASTGIGARRRKGPPALQLNSLNGKTGEAAGGSLPEVQENAGVGRPEEAGTTDAQQPHLGVQHLSLSDPRAAPSLGLQPLSSSTFVPLHPSPLGGAGSSEANTRGSMAEEQQEAQRFDSVAFDNEDTTPATPKRSHLPTSVKPGQLNPRFVFGTGSTAPRPPTSALRGNHGRAASTVPTSRPPRRPPLASLSLARTPSTPSSSLSWSSRPPASEAERKEQHRRTFSSDSFYIRPRDRPGAGAGSGAGAGQ